MQEVDSNGDFHTKLHPAWCLLVKNGSLPIFSRAWTEHGESLQPMQRMENPSGTPTQQILYAWT